MLCSPACAITQLHTPALCKQWWLILRWCCTAVRYALSGWGSFKACLRRDWTLMQRNWFVYTFKTLQVGKGV